MVKIGKKDIKVTEVKDNFNKCLDSLEKYFDELNDSNEHDMERIKKRNEYFKWINLKTQLVAKEKDIIIPEGFRIRRGDVYWIEFGYNIGEEFGGRHPAIVLRKGGNTAIVIPISTQRPTEKQLLSGVYVEINKIYNFKSCKRWINVLNTCPVSICRFCFNSNNGNIKGWELDKINEAMKNTGLFEVKKRPNNNS